MRPRSPLRPPLSTRVKEEARAAEELSGKGRFVESSEERPNSRDRQAPNPGGLKKKKKNKGRKRYTYWGQKLGRWQEASEKQKGRYWVAQ